MHTSHYRLIHQDAVLVSQPILIREFGRVPALLIQQIHYWSQKNMGVVFENQRWINNTSEQWAKQLCVSARTIKRAVQKLTQEGIIFVKKLAKHKSNQTNSYTLNHEKLLKLMEEHSCRKDVGDDLNSLNLNKKTNNDQNHQDILSPSLGHDVTMVIQEITYRDINNKSARGDFALPKNTNEKDKVLQQVEDKKMGDEKGEEGGLTKTPPCTTTVQDMVEIWNNEVSLNKENNKTKLNRGISKYLMSCYKYRFNSDLDAWMHYCRLIASSPYLMGKDFVLSLNWALKYTTIDRILAGDLGVQLRCSFEKPKSEETLRGQALAHIDEVGESEGCKAVRRDILAAVGATQYNAWFTKVDILDNGATLKPHNRFVEEAIRVRFGEVLEKH